MISTEKCPHCKGVSKKHIGRRFKICGYCMQPVKSIERSENNAIGLESVSFLTTSGIIAIGVFGFELSLFNALILGLISAFLITDIYKPVLLTLKAIGVLLIFLFES